MEGRRGKEQRGEVRSEPVIKKGKGQEKGGVKQALTEGAGHYEESFVVVDRFSLASSLFPSRRELVSTSIQGEREISPIAFESSYSSASKISQGATEELSQSSRSRRRERPKGKNAIDKLFGSIC